MKKIIWLFGNIKHFLRKNSIDNVSAIAGQSAFFIILSFVPFLMFAFAILSYLGISQDIFDIYIENILPDEGSRYVQNIINEAYPNAVGIAFTTIILALWSAGKGIYSITEGIRVIYKIPNRMNWFLKRLLSMGYTFVMFLAVILSFGVLVISEIFNKNIGAFIKNLPYSVEVLYAFRYVIMFALLVLLITFALKLYLRNRVKDKRFAKFRLQLPGAVITALSWIVFSKLIRVYVDYFNGFSIYGSLGTAAVVMVWLYFTMLIFLYCIQLNYIYRFKIYNFKIRNLFKRNKKIRKVNK